MRTSRNRPQTPNIVPMKEPNEGRPGRPEEVSEGRAGAKENRDESYTGPTQSGINVSPGLVVG